MVKKHPNPWPWEWYRLRPSVDEQGNMVKKYPVLWPWIHKFRPSVHDRPPFHMSAKQRLYEVRKRYRKTEIRSVYLPFRSGLDEICMFCLDIEDGECLEVDYFCPYAHEKAVLRRRTESQARFHRPTLRERRYERRKRSSRRRLLKMHGYYRRKYPDGFRAFRAALYFTSCRR